MVSGIIAQAPLSSGTHHVHPGAHAVRALLAAVEPIVNDPLRKPHGTTRELLDMGPQSAELLEEGYKRWPKDLPLLMTWGTVDEVNCFKSGVAFFNKLDLKDKKLVEYEGAYHDLLHEVDDIPDKVTEEYISWIESHLSVRTAS
ncbi:hypothetical protein K466DRAFT_599286 [Polyporus arcularius HHB13444]|uniref:Serine aminopeptidase S33 domain-containing protein n=1 Tax=Polyporus arcularius HHB13444 TaxID=1314778 RepID=A0A5C3PEI7_9APHY|nr:hypothetical protein K466DRAFT_599286 [Polyporus arcularius HHB13444]